MNKRKFCILFSKSELLYRSCSERTHHLQARILPVLSVTSVQQQLQPMNTCSSNALIPLSFGSYSSQLWKSMHRKHKTPCAFMFCRTLWVEWCRVEMVLNFHAWYLSFLWQPQCTMCRGTVTEEFFSIMVQMFTSWKLKSWLISGPVLALGEGLRRQMPI